jgi:pimeloyl-ACP methyl ester carboxylesterase
VRTIAFDDLGDRGDNSPALLCLPGWCAPRTAFRPLYPYLEHRTLAVDWRGHGASRPASGDFGLRELVDDAISVIDAAHADRVIPVATAHAGWVAIELRHRLGPERVPAIILVDWMVLGAPPPFLGAVRALQDAATWAEVRAGLFARWTTGVESQPVHDFIAQMTTFGFDMWSRAGREIGAAFIANPVPLDAIAGLAPPPPTLHLYAQPPDPEFLAAQQAFAASHPWFQVQRLDARSHFPTVEVPRDVAGAIDAFAAQISA